MDKVTDSIAHFIGLFQIAAEQARMRDDYLEFVARRAHDEAPPSDEPVQIKFDAPYALDNPEPGIHYVPAPNSIEPYVAHHEPLYAAPEIPISAQMQPVIYPGYVPPVFLHHASSSLKIIDPQPPGSVASIVSQTNHLSDNDFVNVGGSDAVFEQIGTPQTSLQELVDQASQAMPILAGSLPGSSQDIGTFITTSADSIHDFLAGLESGQQAGEAGSSQTIVDNGDGTSTATQVTAVTPAEDTVYVNGTATDEAPKLDDYLPAASPLVEDTPPEAAPEASNGSWQTGSTATGQVVHGQGSIAVTASVEISTGLNVLVNSATLVSDTLEGHVFAIAGDHISLNLIVQINAWSDADSVGASMSGWNCPPDGTTAFNIASMEHVELNTGTDEPSGAGTPVFPKAWAVTEITGDFISLNWLQQLNFVIDNDTVVASSSAGVTSMVGTGANQTFNSLSIFDLGKYFDLILIGGNYYNANIILQKNIMLDDDIVGGVSGFQTSGPGAVSTSDNLLWNEARITNIGTANTDGMPDGFHNALNEFAAGNKVLSADVLNDSAFAGLAGLHVLYISGSIYDLQYIQQTNILGDADQVAAAMQGVNPTSDANWSITTGSNVLVNQAQIIDVGPGGAIYYGGGQYSDELLVQTDIIRTDNGTDVKSPDQLVNEAVAFLSDDMLTPDQSQEHQMGIKDDVGMHPAHTDIMQSVVT
ncbi:hypothetical protein ASD64_09590 [Mesorhizobium sp. Root157]|nr:hypothetical protein ASD64_09590 [Mesorhizobium sp. Root157]